MKKITSDSIEKFYIKFKKVWLTPNRRVAALYFIIFILGALFLWAPFTHNSGVNVDFIDAFFTAGSAFSDTGLSVFDATYLTFNFYGQFVIFILIILGGLGLYTLKIFILSFFIKGLSYRSYQVVSSEMETKSKRDTRNMIRVAFFVSVGSILIFGLILSLFFLFVPASNPDAAMSGSNLYFNDPKGDVGKSFWMGFFTSASALNNAGFDITSNVSFAVYDTNILIQMILMILFIIGGVGFPFIYELIELLKAKKYGKRYRMSLVSKILIASYVLVAFGGLLFVFLFESLSIINNPDAFLVTDSIDLSTGERIWALIFNTSSTRSAGFSTIDLTLLSSASLFIYVILMFIGAGSSSTTGGIRTTTFWIIIIFFANELRSNYKLESFKRTISVTRLKQAFGIFIFSLVFVITCSLFISISLKSNTPETIGFILFTAVSAFGAVGLSVGSIAEWSIAAKLILIILMFFGQLGISNVIRQFSVEKRSKAVQRYPYEDVFLG